MTSALTLVRPEREGDFDAFADKPADRQKKQ